MTLIDQLEQKKLDLQHYIESQSRLHSNLAKSLSLVDQTTQMQVDMYWIAINALEASIGLPVTNIVTQHPLLDEAA